jgi:hypothetical protein
MDSLNGKASEKCAVCPSCMSIIGYFVNSINFTSHLSICRTIELKIKNNESTHGFLDDEDILEIWELYKKHKDSIMLYQNYSNNLRNVVDESIKEMVRLLGIIYPEEKDIFEKIYNEYPNFGC